MRIRVYVFVLVMVLAACGLMAQDATPAPALTEVQRLKVQNLAQRMEIAQLRLQQAQRDFDAAREELAALVRSMQVEGYVLDLSTLTYRKQETTKK